MTVNNDRGIVLDHVADRATLDIDGEDRRRLITAYVHQELGLVDIIAAQIGKAVGSHVERDELIGVGREGLFDAARRFDPARGVPFRAYANIRVQGAMMDHVRRSASLPRRVHEKLKSIEAGSWTSAGASDFAFVPTKFDSSTADKATAEDAMNAHLAAVATAMAASISSGSSATSNGPEPSDPEADPEEALTRAELVEVLRGALTTLDPYESALIRFLYFDGMSLAEVATKLSVTKSWVFRVHCRILARLTKLVRAAS
jgi:RNA polymerase sigma factor for flagellar operon FliA